MNHTLVNNLSPKAKINKKEHPLVLNAIDKTEYNEVGKII